MQKKFDDAGAIAMQVILQVCDRTIPAAPDRRFIEACNRNMLAAENLGMNADDQDLLVIRAIEDADPAALRQLTDRVPQKIVLQILAAWMFEAENLAALWVDARHHVLDDAVLAGRIHRLENQQQRIAV